MNAPILHFDIETMADPILVAEWAKTHPAKMGNAKDPEIIARKKEEHIDKLLDQAARSPWRGRVTCVHAEAGDGFTFTSFGPDEEEVLELAIEGFREWGNEGPIAGFGIMTFDRPFLVERTMGYEIGKLPMNLVAKTKPWETHVAYDLRAQLNDKQFAEGRLQDYCRQYHIEHLAPHDGATIAALSKAEEWAMIRDICVADVRTERALFEYCVKRGRIPRA